MDAIVRADAGGCAATASVPWEHERTTDMHRIFGGVLQSSVVCRDCTHASVISEPFLDLSLEISRAHSVSQALARFTEPETLQGDNRYRCDSCRKLVVAVKRFAVRRAPNVLTLHLKRFDRNKKDGRFIEFPTRLNLGPFMHGKPPGTEAQYLLSGVLVHQGTSRQFGHYVAYVRTADGEWLLKDDSSSRPVPLATVLKQRAYILFYSRILGPALPPKFSSPAKTPAPSTSEGSAGKTPSPDKGEKKHLPSPTKSIGKVSPLKRAGNLASSIKFFSKQTPSKDDSKLPAPLLNADADRWTSGSKEGRIAFSTRNSSPSGQKGGTATPSTVKGERPSSPGKVSDARNETLELSEESESEEECVTPKRCKSSPIRRLLPFRSSMFTGESAKSAGGASPGALDILIEDLPPVPRKSSPGKRSASDGQRTPLRRKKPVSDEEMKNCSDGSSSPKSGDAKEGGNFIKRTLLVGGSGTARKAVWRAFGMLNGGKGERRRHSEAGSAATKDDSSEGPNSRRESGKDVEGAVRSIAKFGRGRKGGKTGRESISDERDAKMKPAAPCVENVGGSSSLFGAEGVDRWENEEATPEPDNGKVAPTKSFGRPRIPKRRRANDELDAEYDRGKQRRVRGRGGPFRSNLGRNLFDMAADRRRKSE